MPKLSIEAPHYTTKDAAMEMIKQALVKELPNYQKNLSKLTWIKDGSLRHRIEKYINKLS